RPPRCRCRTMPEYPRARPMPSASSRSSPTTSSSPQGIRSMLRFRSLGSGSSGNATLVEARSDGRVSRLLIACGFALRHLDARLARVGLSAADIDAVFITHEHGDHIGCARGLSRREGIPVWMSEGTWLANGARDFEG